MITKSRQLGDCYYLAGEEGFEPSYNGFRVRCLTAWLLPNVRELYQKLAGQTSVAVDEIASGHDAAALGLKGKNFQ